MPRIGFLLVLAVCACSAEVRTLTLSEAVAVALKQSPDVLLARLDERKAAEAVRVAHSPFVPKVVVGSGLAYSSGFPMSIEGATPSILQAQGVGSVFNRTQSYQVASAKESRRGAAIDSSSRQDEVIYRVADLYLETEKAAKIDELVKRETQALEGVLESTRARVAEGRELPIEAKKAELNLARARYRMQVVEANAHALQASLAALLGYDPDDLVRPPAGSERKVPAVIPDSSDTAVKEALESSKEIRSLESKLIARGLDVRAQKAAWMPKLDLVAQYALLAKYNNYAEFFNHFQRHNGQLGVSVQMPLWTGPGVDASRVQAESEVSQVRVQIRSTRARVAADTRKAFEDMKQAETAQEVARLDLDVARDQVSILLARMQEGRVSLGQVEEGRNAETEKWIALYDATANLDKARFALLHQTGGLLAALR